MMNIKEMVKGILNPVVRYPIRREFQKQRFSGVNERSIEYRFVFDIATQVSPDRILDVGTGITALPALLRNCGFFVVAIDNVRDYWPTGMMNRHYHVLDEDILNPKMNEKFDLITCISVLEHIPDHSRAIQQMANLLNPGGGIVLTCPYQENEGIENVYSLPDSDAFGRTIPFKARSFCRKDINHWSEIAGLKVVRQEFWKCFEGKFWSCGNQIRPFVLSSAEAPHQLSCIFLRKID